MFASVCDYVHIWVQVPTKPEDRIQSLGGQSCRWFSIYWYECWELNLDLLQEQQVLFISEPSLQPYLFVF